MDEELERFKRLKLHEYAASLGYELDARETSKRETVMRKDGDKISIHVDADGHYVFYSFRDEGDHDPRFRDAPAGQRTSARRVINARGPQTPAVAAIGVAA